MNTDPSDKSQDKLSARNALQEGTDPKTRFADVFLRGFTPVLILLAAGPTTGCLSWILAVPLLFPFYLILSAAWSLMTANQFEFGLKLLLTLILIIAVLMLIGTIFKNFTKKTSSFLMAIYFEIMFWGEIL